MQGREIKIIKKSQNLEIESFNNPAEKPFQKSKKQLLLDKRRRLISELRQIEREIKEIINMPKKTKKNAPTLGELVAISFKADKVEDLAPEDLETISRANLEVFGSMAIGLAVKAAELIPEMDFFKDEARYRYQMTKLLTPEVKMPRLNTERRMGFGVIEETDREM